MKNSSWKRNFVTSLCAIGLATSLGCVKKDDSTVDVIAPSATSNTAAGDTRTTSTTPASGTTRPAGSGDSGSGPLNVRPPESTPPADSRGGSGMGTPTGPGSALPSGTSTDGSQTK